MSADAARRLTDRIKVAVEATWQLVIEAYESRAWAALGYPTWDDYCTREFGASRLRLPREERSEVVASLRDAGLSVRAIAAATGIGRDTVHRELAPAAPVRNRTPAPADDDLIDAELADLAEGLDEIVARPVTPVAEVTPTRTTGTDGKSYPRPGTKVTPPTKPRRPPLVDSALRAGSELRKAALRLERIVTDDRFPANRERVSTLLNGDLHYAREVLADLDRHMKG